MHPLQNYETIRRGHEELLKRAEHERMARKAMRKRKINGNMHNAANWLGIHLVSWGEELEQFGSFTEARHSQSIPRRS
jgi:hypothetical protein